MGLFGGAKPAPKHSGGRGGKPLLGLLFVVFGLLLLGRLFGYKFNLFGIVQSSQIYQLGFIDWVAGIGSVVGGLYLIYKSFARYHVVKV
jgi:hypothetical protein